MTQRLPVAAFIALVIATIAAFFVTQHLKVTTPLLSGAPAPHPAAINPRDGGVCELGGSHGIRPTSFKRMTISFYLLKRADDVDVEIVDAGGRVLDTLARDRHLARGIRTAFTWDGRLADGAYAATGSYDVQVRLIHQGRTVRISDQNTGALKPVRVQESPAPIRVTIVRAGGASPAILPQPSGGPAVIHFTRTGRTPPTIDVYRTDLPGGPRLVNTYAAHSFAVAFWNGTLTGGSPAPQGTYLIGLASVDHTCSRSTFPPRLPPAPGSTPHAGVTVRYLAAAPPMTAVAPGARAQVRVDARRHRYAWALRPAGARTIVVSGHSTATSLSVPVPRSGDRLYALALRYGTHRTVVPIVAGVTRLAEAPAGRVLVVLPALTWQGENPEDDNGDGVPSTLTAGQPVALDRPLPDGLPADVPDDAALLLALRASHRPYTLTTDLTVIAAAGASLRRFPGIVLAGSERWLPASTGQALSTYVEAGGHILSFGIDALRRSVTVSGDTASDPTAPDPVDDLLARPLGLRPTHGALVFADRDRLGLFSGTSRTFRGSATYQPFGPLGAPARLLSAAGVAPDQPAIIGYGLGRGDVVDVGLPGFTGRLDRDVDAQAFLGRAWRLLSG